MYSWPIWGHGASAHRLDCSSGVLPSPTPELRTARWRGSLGLHVPLLLMRRSAFYSFGAQPL